MITDEDGNPIAGDEGPEVIFQGTYFNLLAPVFAEAYVTKLLTALNSAGIADAYESKAARLTTFE